MAALLAPAAPASAVAPISVAVYERMGERINGLRTELIRGYIVYKVANSPLHSFLVGSLADLAQAALVGEAHCRLEQPLRLADSMPEPDLAVVDGSKPAYRREHPTTARLVIEVAVTSQAQDHEKAALYAEAGIPEYWIVLANEEAIEVHTAPQGGRYAQRRVYRGGETLASAALPALRVNVAALFAVG